MKGDIHHAELPVRLREVEWPDFRVGDLAWYRIASARSGEIVGPFRVVEAGDVPERRRHIYAGFVYLENMNGVALSLDGSRLTPFVIDDPDLNRALVAENARLRDLLARFRRSVNGVITQGLDHAVELAEILVEVDAEPASKGAIDAQKQSADDAGRDPVEPEVPA